MAHTHPRLSGPALQLDMVVLHKEQFPEHVGPYISAGHAHETGLVVSSKRNALSHTDTPVNASQLEWFRGGRHSKHDVEPSTSVYVMAPQTRHAVFPAVAVYLPTLQL